jgi:peptidylprolyl isomerase
VHLRQTARRGGALLLAAALLTSCSSSSDDDADDGATTTDLAKVQVTGEMGKKPTVDVHAPFAATKTDRRVLSNGKGTIVKAGEVVTVDYVGLNGTDGRVFSNSFDSGNSNTFALDDGQVIKGMVQGLSGVAVGSRVVIAVPPADGYGTAGVAAAGIGPTDTVLFVVDVKSSKEVLKRAEGKTIKPPKGLPPVKLDKKTGEPTITLPKGKPPTELKDATLIEGDGPVVKKDQTITVNYTGVIWPGGRVFDSTWERDAPANFVIGKGAVIAGWDEGLVGKKVGSQVLLVIPPEKGYGLSGRPDSKIKGTDTLVFVIDILDATAT